MLLFWKEGLGCEVCVDGIRLEHTWDVFWTNQVQVSSREVASGMRDAGAIRSLVNARSLQRECARVLHESLLVPVLTYGSETII